MSTSKEPQNSNNPPDSPSNDSTDRRVLTAARQLFARHGFKGTTTRAIAKEADVNEVTVFRLWGSKKALLNAILAGSLPHGSDAPLARLVNKELRSQAELEAMLTSFLDVFYNQILPSIDDLMQIALKESNEHPEFLEFFAKRTERLGSLLLERLTPLEGILVRPGCAALAVTTMLRSMIGQHLLTRNGHAPAPDLAATVRLFLSGLAMG